MNFYEGLAESQKRQKENYLKTHLRKQNESNGENQSNSANSQNTSANTRPLPKGVKGSRNTFGYKRPRWYEDDNGADL